MAAYSNAVQGRETARAEAASRLARTQRLLRQLRKSLNHDLSNQLVALLGLMRLLELEEGARLSGEGLDYLQRSVAVGHRAQDLVAGLVELAELETAAEAPESVNLSELLNELTAEVRTRHPGSALECKLASDGQRVHAPRRALYRGLVRLVRWLLPADGGAAQLILRSRRLTDAVELLLSDIHEAGWPEPREPPREPADEAPPASGSSVDWLLAQELLADCGALLSLSITPGRGRRITLLLAQAAPSDG